MSDPNVLTWAATLVSLAVAISAAGHAVIYKRDPRSATLWVLLIALLPLGGSLLYLLFGINRYQRRARRLFPGQILLFGRTCRPRCPRLYRRRLPVWPTWWDAPPASR
ncbi:PLDc N-terminal domain-containing protein [Pseudoxanthomonas mexicana]